MVLILEVKPKAMNEECFKVLFKEDYGEVIYDIRTGVQYWRSNGYNNRGTLTLLVDEEGKPLIYDE
jgi:hypothetical protein